jgi:hypothetical protein
MQRCWLHVLLWVWSFGIHAQPIEALNPDVRPGASYTNGIKR